MRHPDAYAFAVQAWDVYRAALLSDIDDSVGSESCLKRLYERATLISGFIDDHKLDIGRANG